jgi:hypothetical protein
MSTTDHSAEAVASLLVTIHRDESGVISTSIEALTPAPDPAHGTNLPDYGSECDVETETLATTTPNGARAARWRRWAFAAAATAVLVGVAVALHQPSRSSDPLSSPGPTVPTAPSKAVPFSFAGCPGAGALSCSDTNTILPGIDAACIDLLTTAARALDEDVHQFAQSLVVMMVHTGKPLADVTRQWLTGAHDDFLATHYADANLETILHGIDSAIALADTGACTPHP